MISDDDFESRILGFERAWQASGPPQIEDFLDGRWAVASPERRRLLLELICVDLEFRWRHGGPTERPPDRLVLEDYVALFPELGPVECLPLEIVGEEYRARSQWGDRPSHASF